MQPANSLFGPLLLATRHSPLATVSNPFRMHSYPPSCWAGACNSCTCHSYETSGNSLTLRGFKSCIGHSYESRGSNSFGSHSYEKQREGGTQEYPEPANAFRKH